MNDEYLIKYVEDHYKEIVEQYEEEISEDHVQMLLEEFPLIRNNLDSIVGLFNEYIINLSIIRTYKGSKLTMEELDKLEQLIKIGMNFIFLISNKDFLENGILNKLIIFVYGLAKDNIPLDFVEIRTDKHGFLVFDIKD